MVGNTTMDGPMPLAARELKAYSGTTPESHQCLEEQCFDAWAEHHRNFADRKRVRDTQPDQTWQLSDWTLGHIRMRQFSTGAEEVVRRPEHVRRSFSEHLAFYISLSGKRRLMVDDEVLCMQQDRILVHDLNLPSHYSTPCSVSALVINVPYSAIGYDPSNHPSTMSLCTGTPIGMIIHNAMMTMYSQASNVDPGEAATLGTGLCGLLRGVIQTKHADPTARKIVTNARLELIKAYIEEHIDDPDLDTALLCRKFAASRATIYRLFSSEGGVATYVTHRRLAHAFRRLRSSPPLRGRVREVAESLGFIDHSHFNRLFRKKFHVSPSDVLGLWAHGSSNSRAKPCTG